jgi:hypothetical protein
MDWVNELEALHSDCGIGKDGTDEGNVSYRSFEVIDVDD